MISFPSESFKPVTVTVFLYAVPSSSESCQVLSSALAPDEVILDLIYNLRSCEGYSDSQGLFSARKAIMQYCQLKHIPNVGIDDIFTGNGVRFNNLVFEPTVSGTGSPRE